MAIPQILSSLIIESCANSPLKYITFKTLDPIGSCSYLGNENFRKGSCSDSGNENFRKVACLDMGSDNFTADIGKWEQKNLISRDGQMELSTQVLFASFDQRSERVAGESPCSALGAVIADCLHKNKNSMSTKALFNTLIRECFLEWRNLCQIQSYKQRFPYKHFDLETVLEAKEAYNIIDTLGERLFEGSNQAYILKFDKNTAVYQLLEEAKSSTTSQSASTDISKSNGNELQHGNAKNRNTSPVEIANSNDVEGKLICKEKESCKEFRIKGFRAALTLRDLEIDIKRGLLGGIHPYQRLDIEFHFTICSSTSMKLIAATPPVPPPRYFGLQDWVVLPGERCPRSDTAISFADSVHSKVTHEFRGHEIKSEIEELPVESDDLNGRNGYITNGHPKMLTLEEAEFDVPKTMNLTTVYPEMKAEAEPNGLDAKKLEQLDATNTESAIPLSPLDASMDDSSMATRNYVVENFGKAKQGGSAILVDNDVSLELSSEGAKQTSSGLASVCPEMKAEARPDGLDVKKGESRRQ
ncbi:hypothetical protein KI387_036005, partial [Taxus chinensis]